MTTRLSYRRMLQQELKIFRAAGKPMLLIVRTDANTVPTYTPGQLFTSDTLPEETTDTNHVYIYGKFDETDVEEFGTIGRKRLVKGIITVPMLYKSLLAAADFIDPYLDGSRFKKTGAIIDEGRIFCSQAITSFTLANTGEVT